MDIRETVRQAIKNTFGLSERNNINILLDDKRAKYIKQLPELITMVAAEHFDPKMIAQKLEEVVVHIKMEDETTVSETRFLKEINRLVYEPQYVVAIEAPAAQRAPGYLRK